MSKREIEHLVTQFMENQSKGKESKAGKKMKLQGGVAAWQGRSTPEMFVDTSYVARFTEVRTH